MSPARVTNSYDLKDSHTSVSSLSWSLLESVQNMSYMAKTRLKLSCLPPNLKDDHCQSLFASVGQLVECRAVRDENTGLCVGSGYVEYETECEAEDAIKMLNGKLVHNKCIKVEHLPLAEDRAPSTRLQIENLPTWFTFSMLGLKFSDFGEVLGCRTETDPQTGMPNGVGFIEFGAKEEAIRAKNCRTGTVLEGASMPLAISFVESQYGEGFNAKENYAGDNVAGGNEFSNSYGGSSYLPKDFGNSWSGCYSPPTFANGPGFQGPQSQGHRMYQGSGLQMNFEGSGWQDSRPQVLPHQERFQGQVPPGFQGPRPSMAPGDFQGPRPSKALGDFQGPRPLMAPGDFQGPRSQMTPGDFQGPRSQMAPGDFQRPRPSMAPGDFQGPRSQMAAGDFQGPRLSMAPGDFQGPQPQMAPGDFQGPRPQMVQIRDSPQGYCGPPKMPSNRNHFCGPVPQTYRVQGPQAAGNDFQQPPVPPTGGQSSRPPMPANNGPYSGQMQMCQRPVSSVPPTNCQGPMPSSRQGPQVFKNGGYSSQMPHGPGPRMHNNGGKNNFVQNEFKETGSCTSPQNEPSNIGPVKNRLPNRRHNPVWR